MASKDKDNLKDLIDQIVEGMVRANRRYIDEVLEMIQDANHRYYLERLAIEAMRLELEEKTGNIQAVLHHRVMIDTYKALLEKTFGPTKGWSQERNSYPSKKIPRYLINV